MGYILAWDPDLQIKDNDGYTPLHLAVKAVDAMESSRPVRFLLIRGADKYAKDHNQKTPIDLVESEINTPELAKEVRNMIVSMNFENLIYSVLG